jgi:sulfonate transport system substrate-binding protein
MRRTVAPLLVLVLAGVLAIAAVLSVAPAGASPTRGKVDLDGVTLKVGDQVHALETLLRSSGQLDGVPYTIEWSAFTSGPPLVEALNADAIDAGIVGDTPPILAQAGGADLKLVAASQGPAKGLAVVVPKGSSITSVKQLQGKKVAYVRGSAAQAFALAAFDKAGLTLDDVEEVNLQPTDAMAAFNGGDIDAWFIWDPFAALVESQGATVILTGEKLSGGLTFVVAREGALTDKGKDAALRDFVGRVAAAGVWRDSHLDEWAQEFAQLTGLPLGIAQTMLERAQSSYLPIGKRVRAAQQKTADLFSDFGVIPERVDVGDTLDPRYNKTVEATRKAVTVTSVPTG